MTPYEKLRGDLKRIANDQHFTATRVGDPGCRVRREAADKEQAMQDAIALLDAAYQPWRRAVGTRGQKLLFEYATTVTIDALINGWETNPGHVIDRTVPAGALSLEEALDAARQGKTVACAHWATGNTLRYEPNGFVLNGRTHYDPHASHNSVDADAPWVVLS